MAPFKFQSIYLATMTSMSGYEYSNSHCGLRTSHARPQACLAHGLRLIILLQCVLLPEFHSWARGCAQKGDFVASRLSWPRARARCSEDLRVACRQLSLLRSQKSYQHPCACVRQVILDLRATLTGLPVRPGSEVGVGDCGICELRLSAASFVSPTPMHMAGRRQVVFERSPTAVLVLPRFVRRAYIHPSACARSHICSTLIGRGRRAPAPWQVHAADC